MFRSRSRLCKNPCPHSKPKIRESSFSSWVQPSRVNPVQIRASGLFHRAREIFRKRKKSRKSTRKIKKKKKDKNVASRESIRPARYRSISFRLRQHLRRQHVREPVLLPAGWLQQRLGDWGGRRATAAAASRRERAGPSGVSDEADPPATARGQSHADLRQEDQDAASHVEHHEGQPGPDQTQDVHRRLLRRQGAVRQRASSSSSSLLRRQVLQLPQALQEERRRPAHFLPRREQRRCRRRHDNARQQQRHRQGRNLH